MLSLEGKISRAGPQLNCLRVISVSCFSPKVSPAHQSISHLAYYYPTDRILYHKVGRALLHHSHPASQPHLGIPQKQHLIGSRQPFLDDHYRLGSRLTTVTGSDMP